MIPLDRAGQSAPAPEKKGRGGSGASVDWMGNRSLLQVAGVLGDGERLLAAATAGPTAPAATASNSRCRPALLGVDVPVVHRLARVAADREA